MPGRIEVYEQALNEGHSAAWDQDWKRAVAEYRRALQEFPNQPKALNSLGLALYQTGEFEEALSIYQQLILLTPDDPVPMEKVSQISEHIGDLKTAEESAMKAAETFIAQHDVNKAIENWSRVITLNPDHAAAHSRLALVYERLGKNQQAVTEYLAVASVLQRAGKVDKAQEIVTKTLQMMPDNADAKQAQSMLKKRQPLARSMPQKAGTLPTATAKEQQAQEPMQQATVHLDPLAEAVQKALSQLAEILFEYSDDSPSSMERGNLLTLGKGNLAKGSEVPAMQQAEQTKAMLHLGQAIHAQAMNEVTSAADELEHALEAGFKHPALHFDIGYLRAQGDHIESALPNLERTVEDKDFGLGSRLLVGEILLKKGQVDNAALEYLEALELADSMTVPEEQATDIRQLYEPLIEAQQSQKDEKINQRLCENIRSLLMRENWRENIQLVREQTHRIQDGSLPNPLAEIMLEAQSSGMIEAMHHIRELARGGSLRSAMDEAYDAVQHTPGYLPLHSLIGELLMQESRTQDAIAKFSVVAQAYGARGEVSQASRLLRRIIQLAPMDLPARRRLIDQLVAHDQVDEAIQEYIGMADIYYRQAELEMARQTYMTALRMVQQAKADRSWSIQILRRIADIDMQRLDWKEAARIYEQIRTIQPDDQAARKQLVELYTRMGQVPQATFELERFLTYLESNGRTDESLPFLQDLLMENEDSPFIRRALAEQLHQMGQTDKAVSQLDSLGESLLQSGKIKEAVEVIGQILAMNPPNANDYRTLLNQIQK